jgi:hypothetical protein
MYACVQDDIANAEQRLAKKNLPLDKLRKILWERSDKEAAFRRKQRAEARARGDYADKDLVHEERKWFTEGKLNLDVYLTEQVCPLVRSLAPSYFQNVTWTRADGRVRAARC